MDPPLHTRCSVSDFNPEVHALLNEIVHPTPGYERHCKLLVFGFRIFDAVEWWRD
jgi:hypothetical protein